MGTDIPRDPDCPPPDIPSAQALERALDADDKFRRDSGAGSIYHRGAASFREIRATDSVHIIINGDEVSAHVDRVSPLKVRPDGSSRYAFTRVIAHNVAGMVGQVTRCLPQPARGRDQARAKAIEPAASGIPTVAFSAIDESVHLLDSEAAPWSIQLELRVAGHLDEGRLREAFARAIARHPLAGARKLGASATECTNRWEIGGGLDIDPLRVVHCEDDGAIARVREDLQSIPVPLVESPPLRARLVRTGDGGDLLMVNANHAAMDGFGVLRVVQSVARAYAGQPDPCDGPDPIDARTHVSVLTAADRRIRTRRRLALAEKLTDLAVGTTRLARDGANAKAGYGFHHLVVPSELGRALVELDHPGTVNDVLLTGLHLAIARWNEGRGKRCGRIGVLVPANLRPAEWRHEVVGNLTLPTRISTGGKARRRPDTALAAITAQTKRKKDAGMGTALLELLSGSERLPLWAKAAMVHALPLGGNRLVDTAMLSNLGTLRDPPSFGADAGPTVEAWFSAPGRMPLGLTVGVVTLDDRLHVVLRYRHRQFDARAAARFADAFLNQLRALTGS